MRLEDLLLGKNNHPIDLISVLSRNRFNFDELSNKLIFNCTYNRLTTTKSDYNIDQSFVKLCNNIGISHSKDCSYRYYINLFYLLTTLSQSDINKYIKYTYDQGSIDNDFDSSIKLVTIANFESMIEYRLRQLLNRKVQVSSKPIRLIYPEDDSLYAKVVDKYNSTISTLDNTMIDLKLLYHYGVIEFIDLSIVYLNSYLVDRFINNLNDINYDNEYVNKIVNTTIINKNYTNISEFFKDLSDIFTEPISYN